MELEYIIALGKNTYEIILEALELEIPKIASFNYFIVTQNEFEYGKSKIYVTAHAGGMGSANRKKGDKSNKTSIELQKEDWIKIFFNMTYQILGFTNTFKRSQNGRESSFKSLGR
ncbi:hypothetical protein [Campylobacter lanienae]|uniref:hypothetical protein n=2 Tax=Campylobacteraceae TaxID=72294 RepID=UPI000BB4001E|nr:hypothetical protein [Campylobacter lanienae]